MTDRDNFAQLFPDADMRIKRIEHMLVRFYVDSRIYIGVCVNAAQCPSGKTEHPHWEPIPQVDWDKPIIYL